MTSLPTEKHSDIAEEYFDLANSQIAGQLIEDALQNYRRVLKICPEHFAAKNNLGQGLYSIGRIKEAMGYFQEIIAEGGELAAVHYNLANCFLHEGRSADAVNYYKSALRIQPEYPDAWHNLGLAYKEQGSYHLAEEAFRNELLQKRVNIEGWFLLGMMCQLQSKLPEAVVAYQEALKIGNHVIAAYNLGICLHEQGHYDMAVNMFESVIGWQPDNAQAWNNLGRSLDEGKQQEKAVTAYKQAISLQPDFSDAIANLGSMFREEGKLEQAVECYHKALSYDPEHAQSLYNLGCCYQGINDLGNAEYWYRRSIKVKPELVEAHWNLSHVLLLRGEYDEGFKEYQWRWRRPTTPKPPLSIPEWQGEEAPEATLLVHTEQGFGDSIQFIRYLHWARKRVGRLIFVCEESLMPLFTQNNLGCDAIISKDAMIAVANNCDIQAGLLALPSFFSSEGDAVIPPPVCLRPSGKLIAEFEPVFQENNRKKRIGIVWQGSKQHKNDLNRSCPIAVLQPLLDCRNTLFYSLQKDYEPSLPADICDLSVYIQDFHCTAALIHYLDLVITVDTSVAHLTGSMGKDVWLMLPFVPDWRWLLGVEDTPWYPSMRLFRQEKSGDWDGVISKMVDELGLMNAVF